MQTRSRGDYTIANRELVAEGADLRVQVLSLAAGQCVPWHYHSEISDNFVCLEGPMVVETRARRHVYRPLTSLGVVYGDIGTSPLCAFKEAVRAASPGFCWCGRPPTASSVPE